MQHEVLNMGIFEDFDDELFQRTGKHYNELNTTNKIKVLNEAEIRLEQIAAKRRAIIRQLRRNLV